MGQDMPEIIHGHDNTEQSQKQVLAENMGYFRWSFTIPNFKIIYMDSGLYWEIKQLTTDKLHIYETYDDPITVPGQDYREYREYESLPLSTK